MTVSPPAGFDSRPITPLPQRILLVENSRTFTTMLREAIEQRLELPVSVASSLAEAGALLDAEDDWFLVLTGLVLSDGDRDGVVAYFVERGLPTIVVSSVYDEDLRRRVLQQDIIDYVLKNTPGSLDYLVWLVQRLERNRRISALVVDDSPSARGYAASLLAMYGYRVAEAGDGQAALQALEADPAIRLAIVDQEMPGMDGVELTRRLRALRARDRVAVIGISGNSDPSLIPRFLKNGANDFLRKPFSREEFFCRVSQNVDQLELIGTLQDLATRDFLTGLPNRQQLQQQLDKILVDGGRLQHRVAVLCVGLDDFKGINEQFSYQVGDQLLLALADRLRAHSGRLGALARLGGDQFALVQANIEQPYEAAELAQSILDDLEVPFDLDHHQQIRLRATIGITLFPEDGDSTEKLLQKAEQTMTLAKARSRNRYQFYIASVDSEMRRRRELEKDLREALPRNQLYLVYQPQISYRDHRVVGVEALLRWQHPELGMVPPDQFIPLAEQNGSIISIGEWVLDQACRQLREWHDMGFSELRMAVNLSTVQLHHSELPRVVNNLLQAYRLPPRSLELEVTETGLMEDISTAAQHLLSLRRSGALIAIDDFGTGYSSLSYLKSLPLDKIKIDKSFVQDLLDDDDDATIVRAIIQLGKSLGMQVIAEGVETAEQETYIVAQGCHEGQGYHYSKPLSARELTNFLKQAQRNQVSML